MKMLEQYSQKFGIPEITNDYGEHRKTFARSIVFPNGWVASIIEDPRPDLNTKYSVAMCDYNGYFDWSILNKYGARDGCFYCDTELDILIACETIRRLENTN